MRLIEIKTVSYYAIVPFFSLIIVPLLIPAPSHATPYSNYDTTLIKIISDTDIHSFNKKPTGETMTVWIADSHRKRYRGLSGSETLPENRGMLFVYDQSRKQRFSMRSMKYGLDIIFINSSGEITSIESAPIPRSTPTQTYTGWGQWVLEVRRDWTTRNEITGDDRVIGLK